MPRNRRPRDREEKRAEIVAAARELFLVEGYESVSMARVARAAGVVSNTVYWYFQDKDTVLLAVLDDVLTEALSRYGSVSEQSPAQRLGWVVGELRQASRLVTTVHARSKESEVVREWHERFHALTDGLLRQEFAVLGLTGPELTPMSSIAVFVIEGLLMHPTDEETTESVVNTLLTAVRATAAGERTRS
ncbi:TetR/AcrR family transcriptional regulator [Nocardia alni]|uniref:TetR/AcrR family transcriptional regulator n=1 Tax=Nocardia alni TaxID=2815723 RepID=UPI001C246EAA|nr:TetR/AcrR family transcriptional regulator [Nocardia alni]